MNIPWILHRANGCKLHKNMPTKKEKVTCRGILRKSGEKCTKPAHANGYCGYHTGQAGAGAVATRQVTPGKCRRNCTRAARAVSHQAVSPVSRELMVTSDDIAETLRRLVTIIDLYAIRDRLFIGKASGGNHPEKRWSQKYAALGYERMQVLCEVPKVRDALWLEQQLVAHFKSVDGVNVQNPIAGGGGAKGKDPGYVYLVIG